MPKKLPPKEDLLLELLFMPEEAFTWLQHAIVNSGVWPDGTGGFSRESRESIVGAVKAARRGVPTIKYPKSNSKLPKVVVPKR